MGADHYRMLGVSVDATSSDLRAAYLKLARANHPDTFEGADRQAAQAKMQSINEAWNVLGTPHRRAEYDRTRDVDEPVSDSHRRGRSHFQAFEDSPWDRDVDLDPTPIVGSRPLPQWISMMPVGFIVAGIMCFGFGLLLRAASIVALAATIFALGVVGFLALPLWVMSRAERDPRL